MREVAGDISTVVGVQIPTGPFNIVFYEHRSIIQMRLIEFSREFVAFEAILH
ncbi:MAG: hypothetical protein ACFFDT_40710 [Candidatus Hodarchaeota archaeon]